MKNICFVPCFGKAKLYRKIADYFINNFSYTENNFFWIINDKRDLKIIKSDNCIFLNFLEQKNREELYDLTLNEIIESDRLLKKNKQAAKNYLINLEYLFTDFIEKNAINYIFGERANAHELLLGRLCLNIQKLNCSYFSITDIRIPSLHYAFFSDEKETALIEINKGITDEPFKLEKPSYLTLNDNLNKLSSYIQLNRIKRIFSNISVISRHNVVGYQTFAQYLNAIFKREFNRLSYKFVKKENFDKYLSNNYIFYGFHKQPESSIDVCGRYIEDQYQNIYNLWRLLPKGWLLLVKEHTNALGDRSYKFYRKIQKLPGVILINEKTDSYKIMKNAKITFSVTGTISLEAALMGKISVTFAKTFFNKLNNCFCYSFTDLEKIGLTRLAASQFENNIEQYKQYILNNSFHGSVLDCYADPKSLGDTNIEVIAKSIKKLVKDE